MKYFITIALTLALIHLTKSQDDYGDYGDDAGLFSYDEAEDRIDDSPKPTYDLKDAPTHFEQFIKDYKKVYKNEKDYNIHYRNFVENLKEINKVNSDKDFSSTVDINLFSDLSPIERQSLLGVASF